MSPRDRRKNRSLRPALGLDALEPRQLLAVAALAPRSIAPVHLDFSPGAEHLAPAVAKATVHEAAKAPRVAKAKAEHARVTPAKPAGAALGRYHLDVQFHGVTPTKVDGSTAPSAGDFTPAMLETAYGVSQLPTSNEGQGVTIAIIDAYNDPTILNDTNVFSNYFKLPTFTSSTLRVIKDTTFGSVPNIPSGDGDQSFETSLDVEWAHAMAPKANIDLIEVPALTGQDILQGIQYAALQPGVVVASLSAGSDDSLYAGGGYNAANRQYLATGAAFNIAVTVSTGDSEFPSFPATSPNVIAVGGTALFTSATGVYNHETGWGNSTGGAGGGGYSGSFLPPRFQANNGVNFPFRTVPDVSALADPATGVSIFDSDLGGGAASWFSGIGGTSLASPLTAGVISLAQQDRTLANKPILNSTQINNLLYETYLSPTEYAKYFNDVKLGNNNADGQGGYTAKVGYDFATGLGSIKANTVVPYLAGA